MTTPTSEQFEEIAALAYKYYVDEGRPEGRAAEHWARAQREILSREEFPPENQRPSEAAGEDFR